jgi:hypothetical protein
MINIPIHFIYASFSLYSRTIIFLLVSFHLIFNGFVPMVNCWRAYDYIYNCVLDLWNMGLHSCVTLCFIFVYTLGTAFAQDSLPTVDLGYSIHHASFNVCSSQKGRNNWIGSSELFTDLKHLGYLGDSQHLQLLKHILRIRSSLLRATPDRYCQSYCKYRTDSRNMCPKHAMVADSICATCR